MSGLSETVASVVLQYTWHHREDQEEGDRQHLHSRAGWLPGVMAEGRAAMCSVSSLWPRLITLVGATPEDVVDSAKIFDE